jgi:hypothetical protein
VYAGPGSRLLQARLENSQILLAAESRVSGRGSIAVHM